MRYESARQMIFEAYLYQRGSLMAHASEKAKLGADVQLTRRNTIDARICHGLEAGQVIARVESLPTFLQSLLMVTFGPFTATELDDDRERVTVALYSRLIRDGLRLPARGQGSQIPRAEQYQVLRALCVAAIHHHSETTWPYSRPGLSSPRAIQRWLLDHLDVYIDKQGWTRRDRPSWGRVWDCALHHLGEWEGQALAPVGALLEEHKEARREGRAASEG